MGIWENRRDRALGRKLRAARPQAREEFVRMLAERVPAQRVAVRGSERRRSVVPRVVVIATVTVSVAVALGATGAASYAGGSLQSLSKSLAHVVTPAASPVLPFTLSGAASEKSAGQGSGASKSQGSSGSGDLSSRGIGGQGSSFLGGGNSGGLLGGGSGILGGGGLGIGLGNPFNSQYGLQIPTCQNGQTVFVSLSDYIYLLLHGDPPTIGIFCSSR